MHTAEIFGHVNITEANLKDTSTVICNSCHSDPGNGSGAPVFSEIHNGYDPEIYADGTGLKYSAAFIVTIDDTTTFNPATNVLTIDFSATEAFAVTGLTVDNSEPTVMVGLYG